LETQKNITVKITAEFHCGNDLLEFYQANPVAQVLSMRTGMAFEPPHQESVSHLFGIWKTEAIEQITISFPPLPNSQEET
jgi:hypothetical protein